MDIAKQLTKKSASVRLSGETSLREISAVHEVLLEALDVSRGPVAIDVTSVEKGGLPLLQLLVSAQRTLQAQGRSLVTTVADGSPLHTVAFAAALADELGLLATSSGSEG